MLFILTVFISASNDISCTSCKRMADVAISATRDGYTEHLINHILFAHCQALGEKADVCYSFVSNVTKRWVSQSKRLSTTPEKLCSVNKCFQERVNNKKILPYYVENMAVPVNSNTNYPTKRPNPEDRRFRSQAVEDEIREIKSVLTDKKLSWMFENCYPNTLDTTVYFQMNNSKPDTFVITGDIDAMWLRDSGAQVYPYVSLLAEKKDPDLQRLIAGVINRQLKCIQLDPYANGFTHGEEWSEWKDDYTDMKPYTHERKYEIDSLCYPIRLAYQYWTITGDDSIFIGDNFMDWTKATKLIVQTFKEQQRTNGTWYYTFMRKTERQLDTVNNNGRGSPINPVGLIVSFFRPSDDATTFPFLIPSNMFAVKTLRQLAEISHKVTLDYKFANECIQLADQVEAALKNYSIVDHPKYGKIYAYEVDGYGSYYMMDDANVPSLLSLPYITSNYIDINDEIYQNTRRFVWSFDNPYFFKGKMGEGVGGPHIGYYYAWPMSLIIRALTSKDDEEIRECVRMLRDTDGNTGFMHESFLVDNPSDYTRTWFAWANTLFGELIIKLVKEGKVDILNNL